MEHSVFDSLGRTVGPAGPFFPSCLPGTLLNTATYAQALSHVASLKGKIGGCKGGVDREGGNCLASLMSLLDKQQHLRHHTFSHLKSNHPV